MHFSLRTDHRNFTCLLLALKVTVEACGHSESNASQEVGSFGYAKILDLISLLLYIYRSQTQLNRTGKEVDGFDEGDGEEKAMIT